MMKVEELSAQLKEEKMKSLNLEKHLQTSTVTKTRMEQLQERISEVEQERDLLKENNEKLLSSALDVSRQQKWQVQEQQLRLQIVQLETALKADLVDKNQILDKVKAERDVSEKLRADHQKLEVEFLEQKQQMEELRDQLRVYNREGEYDAAELTEALLLIQAHRSQKNGDLGFLKEVDEEGSTVCELRAAHAETIQELQKTRNLLSMESKICSDYKVELEAVLRKAEGERAASEQKLQQQTQLLHNRSAKIRRLEAQLRDIAYGTKTYGFKPDCSDKDEAEEREDAVHLERGENLLELQIVGITLSPPALELLGDGEPSTFCTYSFYLFEPHSTPVVTGRRPRYGFTSKYVVSMDERFLDYLRRRTVGVELHQALGLDWTTLATGQLRLQQLLEQDGGVHGTAPLIGVGDDLRSFGSVDFSVRLRLPLAETLHLHREKESAVCCASQLQSSSGWNQLDVTVESCRELRRAASTPPSPYVVYKFSDFPDHPTATVHDRSDPRFHDLRSFSITMDVDLDRYLRSEVLWIYVFDYKEECTDKYVGKARVPLLPLVQNQNISGEFELADPSGLPAGHVTMILRWKLPYVSPSASVSTQAEERHGTEDERTGQDSEGTRQEDEVARLADSPPLQADLSHIKLAREGPTTKRVTFMESTDAGSTQQDANGMAPAERRMMTSLPVETLSTLVPQSSEGDGEEESQVSEGQLVHASSLSYSDDSEISEEMMEDADEDGGGSAQSDSDDCIVEAQAAKRKLADRLRVEISSLSLRPECSAAQDVSVVRLFVEYSLLDLPTEETPMSLPKPPHGKSINYNYSKVVPVDAEKNGPRRRLLRRVLQGRNRAMERIRFTVVSEPPEEEEQERECEDVGVAFIRIPEILERRQDLTDTILHVMDVEDSSEVVGSLTVSVEGLEALKAIMEDQDQDQDQDQD